MTENFTLIVTLVSGLGLAFVFGLLAHSLRLSPLVGYLLAGVLIGPFTPGFVADQALASQLAELGIILLNAGDAPFTVERGMRIAQAVLAPVTRAAWAEVATLPETARGTGGFGSTGTNTRTGTGKAPA